jgi:Flp pilus assembly protein TadG
MMLMRGLNRVTASGNDLHAGSGLGALLSLGEEGGALVESAIVLPIMLLISTGLLIFGIAVNNYLCLTEATSTGARLLAVSRGQTLDPCATTVTAIENAAPTLTPGNFTFTFVLNGTNYPGSTCSSKNTSSGAAANLVQGKSATVTVAYPCALGIFGETFSAKGCTLTSQTTELVQ